MALADKFLINPITNEINLSSWQEDFVFSDARYKVACCGRRSGKSTASCVAIYQAAVEKPHQRIWAVATTYGQAKKLYFQELQNIIPREWIKTVNKSELALVLINDSVIELKGANNEDALLGDSLDLLVLDEYQSQNPDVMEKLTPMLADRKGKMIVVGTPRGYNHFYDIWCKGQKDRPEFIDGFYSVQVKTVDAETIPAEEIEDARKRMTESMFSQEFEASFESVSGLVYREFDDTANVDNVTIQPNEHILVGMDFNVGSMAAVIAVKRGGKLYIIDDILLKDSNTTELCQYIKNIYGSHAITVFPDPAGAARSTTGNTNHQIIRGFGFGLNTFKTHPRIQDRVNCVNALFLNASGMRRCFVSSTCTHLMKTLKGQVYNDKTGQPDKTSGLDHHGDALGYLITYLFPINNSMTQSNMFGA